MLIVVNDVTGCLVIRPATRWERALVCLRADSLDRRLAAGRAPETDALLALRAADLVRPAVRLRLAHGLQGILHEAASPDRYRRSILSAIARGNVRNAADLVATLIERLRSPYPVSACGMAKVNILLTDGAGPLYYPSNREQLRRAVHEAINDLEAPMTA